MALTTACPCDSSASYSRPSPRIRLKIHISATANDPSRSNTTAQGKRKTLFTSKMPMVSHRRNGNANSMISVDRLDRVYHEEVGREQGGLREQLAHARPNPFQHCHDLAWDRVEFKMLRFKRCPATSRTTSKTSGGSRRGQRELATLAGLNLPSLGNREP
jgi:hypothetical protein